MDLNRRTIKGTSSSPPPEHFLKLAARHLKLNHLTFGLQHKEVESPSAIRAKHLAPKMYKTKIGYRSSDF